MEFLHIWFCSKMKKVGFYLLSQMEENKTLRNSLIRPDMILYEPRF